MGLGCCVVASAGRCSGREIVLAFDSDVVHKPSVYQTLDGLAGYLESKGAGVQFCHLPPGDEGGKTGLDDYFAAEHSPRELRALVSAEMPALTEDGKRVGLARRARRGRKNVVYAADLAAKSASTESTPPPEPEPFTGNAAALLDAVLAFPCTYVAFPTKAAAAEPGDHHDDFTLVHEHRRLRPRYKERGPRPTPTPRYDDEWRLEVEGEVTSSLFHQRRIGLGNHHEGRGFVARFGGMGTKVAQLSLGVRDCCMTSGSL